MIDWDDIRVFAVLAREGSLAGAARLLRVNHATVARRVAALESALGLKLATRLARSTPLIADGVAIAALAENMEDAAHHIRRRARDASATLVGKVTIAASPVVANEVLIPGLATFRALHPHLAIDLRVSPAQLSLGHGEADLAVRLMRPEQLGLIARRLGAMSFGCYAARAIAALPSPAWTFIAFDDSLDHVPQQRWLHEEIGDRPIVFRTSDIYGQHVAAVAGLGVALLPCIIGDHATDFVRVAPDRTPPPRALWLAIHADLQRAPAVRAVADHIVALFEGDRRFS